MIITLEDFLKDLTYGEFSQLNLGNFLPEEFESEPDPKSYAQLSSHINLALKSLYSKFLLARGELTLQLYAAIETYTLSFDFAVSNVGGAEPVKYIVDTAEIPFLDDVLRIEEVFGTVDTVANSKLYLNDVNQSREGYESLFTPTYRSLKVVWPNTYDTLKVTYRAAHEKITYAIGMDPSAIELVIPDSLHEAALYHVAARVFSSLNTDGQGVEGNDYWAKYLAKVQEAKDEGMYIIPEPSNQRFVDNGWV